MDVDFPGALEEAVAKGHISDLEAKALKEVQAARYDAIQVDEYPHDYWAKKGSQGKVA